MSRPTIFFYEGKETAEAAARISNRWSTGQTWIVCEGPSDDFAVMPMAEAVESDFVFWIPYWDGSVSRKSYVSDDSDRLIEAAY